LLRQGRAEEATVGGFNGDGAQGEQKEEGEQGDDVKDESRAEDLRGGGGRAFGGMGAMGETSTAGLVCMWVVACAERASRRRGCSQRRVGPSAPVYSPHQPYIAPSAPLEAIRPRLDDPIASLVTMRACR
jgi:hypothetical protein